MNSFIRSAIIRKTMLIMVLVPVICIFLSSSDALSAKPDTTWSVTFHLNMTKAINQHIFIPDSDYVYLILNGTQEMRLVQGPGFVYSATLFDQLDSSAVYQYKFSINDSINETVNRSFKPKPGMIELSAWWNNEPINITTFIVNMIYAAQYGLFNPVTDSVFLVGTMNNMAGSPKMQRIDTTLNYSYIDSITDPGSVQQYKYRINLGDSAKGQVELLFRPNRII
ncbi:MAG: hypothetical protein WCK34_18790, partial [Bacteroidota bacterium]